MQAQRTDRRITTVTLNPAIDEAVALDAFVLGAVNRCRLDALDPGGKGVNVSRVIRRWRRETLALGFVGGVTGAMLRKGLDEEGVPHAFDDVAELTRINVMIYEHESGRRSRLYLPGAFVESAKLDALRKRLEEVPAGAIVVIGGSLPPGVSPEVYGELVTLLAARGARSIVDTSGEALERVLASHPLLIKPNLEEAEELLRVKFGRDEDVLLAARELRSRGAENVVISQGADGAIGVGPGGCWKALPPAVRTRSTVGSGDSMLAGLAIAFNEGGDLREGLRLGTAMGAATAMIPGTRLCRPEDVDRLLDEVVLHQLTEKEPAIHGFEDAVPHIDEHGYLALAEDRD